MSGESLRREPLRGGFALSLRNGRVEVRELCTSVFEVRYFGVGHAGFVPEIQRPMTQRIQEGYRVSICVDATELGAYDTDFRRHWTRWFLDHKKSYYPVPILFRSALVRMGINLVNPLIGNLIAAYSERADFDAALRAAVVRANARGLVA